MSLAPEAPAVLASRLSAELPVQRAFAWNRSKWAAVVHDAPDAVAVLEALPDRVDRKVIREVVQANLASDRVLGAFVAVFMWGSGSPGGYGPHRARTILTGVNARSNLGAPVDERIRHRLLAGAATVREHGPGEAFRLMNNEGKIKHLGGAFFTKWLAFTSMVSSVDGPEVAPILDKRVRDWIAEHTAGVNRISLWPTSTADYHRYLDLLDAWRAPFNRSRAQVELAIFDLTRDRPATS